jgi:glycosyltransferase involved in cell wall biosynthesis
LKSSPPKVLFLYTELGGYTIACLNKAVQTPIELHVVRWPVNNEAPFKFSAAEGMILYDRSKFTEDSLLELCKRINPDLILSSGWVDSGYSKIAKHFKPKIPVVLGLDNHWRGTLKQWLACTIGRVWVHRRFSHCWVPGKPQLPFAKNLGFAESKIRTGFYVADTDQFIKLRERTLETRLNNFPKRFLYVGRYLELKGIVDLWQAYKEMRQDGYTDWELWCVGAGELFDSKPEIEGLRHLGFLQPAELEAVISQCGVFVLPSHRDAWGAVVHEFTIAGFPMICSAAVGGVTMFLETGKNGTTHKPGDVADLKQALIYMSSLSNDELIAMSKHSIALSEQLDLAGWSKNLLSFLNK